MDHPDDLDTLRAALDRILAQLTRLGAPVADQLQPGLTDDAIVEAFRDLPFVPPRELRALYAWRNGTANEVDDFFPEYAFLSLSNAILEYRAWREIADDVASSGGLTPADIWDPHWFPIFRLQGAFQYVMLCPEHETDTAPILFVCVEDGSHNVQYTSLTHMMQVFADCYETGAFTLHPDGYLEDDKAKVGAIRRAYTPTRAEVALEALRQRATGPAFIQAINDVIDLHDPRAVEPLLALLHGDGGAINGAAILPLGILSDECAIPPLLAIVGAGRAMRDEARGNLFAYALHMMDEHARMDSLTRMQAIDAVERIAERTGQPLPLDPFIAAMDDPEPMVRQRAARRLGTSGDARALPALVAALGDYDQKSCYVAIEALAQLGDPRALEPLRQFAGDPDPNEAWHANPRQAARAAIARIQAATSNESGG